MWVSFVLPDIDARSPDEGSGFHYFSDFPTFPTLIDQRRGQIFHQVLRSSRVVILGSLGYMDAAIGMPYFLQFPDFELLQYFF